MRCGRSGCECTTCPECGDDYPCRCPLKARAKVFIDKNYGTEDPELLEATQSLRTFNYA